MECVSHSYCVLPGGLMVHSPVAAPEEGPAVQVPAQPSGMCWQRCDASRASLYGGLHLGLQVEIKIRYHIYAVAASQQWFSLKTHHV